MKVAFIDQRGDEPGGAERSLALLLQHLPAEVNPTAIFFEDGRFAENVRASGIGTIVIPLGEHSRRSTRERPRLRAMLELPACAITIARYLRELRIDVVHTNTVKAHVIGGIAARLAGKPSVAHLRDIMDGTGRAVVRNSIALTAKHRIAISRGVARSFRLRNTSVIDNPLDLASYAELPERKEARRRLDIDDDVPTAILVGRINRWKGQDTFLRALASVNQTVPTRGLIVGAPLFRDEDFLPELHELSRALQIEDMVSFIPWVDDPREIYAAADFNVNASVAEPFGRTVIEAAASGLPTVCFDDSGVSETMNAEMGVVVPAGDECGLARAIKELAATPQKTKRLGSAARIWSSRFDAQTHARRVTDVLNKAFEVASAK